MGIVYLTVSFMDYEKRLMEDFKQVFPEDASWRGVREAGAVKASFDLDEHILLFTSSRYKWFSIFRKAMQDVLNRKEWYSYHNGQWDVIWECLERVMMRHNANKLQVQKVIAANRHLSLLELKPGETVGIAKVSDDDAYWEILSNLIGFYENSYPALDEEATELEENTATMSLQEDGHEVDNRVSETNEVLAELSEGFNIQMSSTQLSQFIWEENVSSRVYEIWSLLRSCALIIRRDQTSTQAIQGALDCAGFYKYHTGFRNLFIRNQTLRSGEDFTRGITLTSLGRHLARAHDHPLKCVEYIPWEQLEMLCSKDSEISEGRPLMLWNPTSRLVCEKHLYTEDSVFSTCVMSGIQFPEYMIDDKVVFAVSPISNFLLDSGSSKFWDMWNDCCVTHDSSNKTFHLLETLPGLKFRAMTERIDRSAAMQYYHGYVANIVQGRTESVAGILGSQFKAQYENLLHLIPHSQISDINPVPLGEGTRGVVYKAKWSHPVVFGDHSSAVKQIVLKSIKIQDPLSLVKFMKELDHMFAAVTGDCHGLLKLHGIMKTPEPSDLHAPSPDYPLPWNTLFLVLDFVEHGGLKGHLSKILKGTRGDWYHLMRFVTDITYGLCRIHERKLIHRDIHWENVLVFTKRYAGGSGPVIEDYEVLISDFGEAQHISTAINGRTYYGNKTFWAPEVHKYHKYSPASDVYALGCLFLGMVQLHWDLVEPKTPGSSTREIPEELIFLITDCLQPDPAKRSTAHDVMNILDPICTPTFEELEDGLEEDLKFRSIDREKFRRILGEHTNSEDIELGENENEDDIVI